VHTLGRITQKVAPQARSVAQLERMHGGG